MEVAQYIFQTCIYSRFAGMMFHYEIKMIEDIVYKASRLIYKGLQPRNYAEKDKEYAELLRLCLSSFEFTDHVKAIAEGLSLQVVDISDKGIILSPASTDSRFAMGLSEYRKELEGEVDPENTEAQAKRGLIALIQVAIAATFFPTAEILDDDDYEALGKSATLKDFNAVLLKMCDNVIKEDDQEVIAPSLQKGARWLKALPDSLPKGKTATFRSKWGAISIIANHLDRSGLLKFQKTSDGDCYFPTYRYQQLLRRRAVGHLFDLCHQLAQVEPISDNQTKTVETNSDIIEEANN